MNWAIIKCSFCRCSQSRRRRGCIVGYASRRRRHGFRALMRLDVKRVQLAAENLLQCIAQKASREVKNTRREKLALNQFQQSVRPNIHVISLSDIV